MLVFLGSFAAEPLSCWAFRARFLSDVAKDRKDAWLLPTAPSGTRRACVGACDTSRRLRRTAARDVAFLNMVCFGFVLYIRLADTSNLFTAAVPEFLFAPPRTNQ